MAPTIRAPAPTFTLAGAKQGDIVNSWSLEEQKGSWTCILFYPMDFTFVCPTEIISYSKAIDEFTALNCNIVGISGDSPYVHLTWEITPATQGGLENQVVFPLLSDVDREVMKAYGVYNPDKSGLDYAQAFRGLFLIDDKGVLRHVYINDNGVGRNVDETLRVLEGLQYTDKFGEVCPAGWHKGDKGMKATKAGVSQFLVKKLSEKN
ncbi:hypothetical protein WA158_004731 [Blastocystis sp. Blastoise]